MSTPEQQTELIAVALTLAAIAPVKRSEHAMTSQVPWWLIEQARERAEAAGFDWRELKRKMG